MSSRTFSSISILTNLTALLLGSPPPLGLSLSPQGSLSPPPPWAQPKSPGLALSPPFLGLSLSPQGSLSLPYLGLSLSPQGSLPPPPLGLSLSPQGSLSPPPHLGLNLGLSLSPQASLSPSPLDWALVPRARSLPPSFLLGRQKSSFIRKAQQVEENFWLKFPVKKIA